MPERNGRSRAVVLTCGVLVAVPFFLRLALVKSRGFNPDELQHLHGAWCVAKGLVPYRDYFDHHTPLLHFLLAPFIRFFDVDVEVNDAFGFIFFARRLMWAFAGLILLLTYSIGRFLGGRTTGALAALALSNVVMFLSKTVEVRPDVPAAALLLLAVFCGMRGSGSPPVTGLNRRITWFSSGLALGAAVLCTQKVVFPLLGFGVALLVSLVGSYRDQAPRVRWADAIAWAVGIAVPCVLVGGYFAWQGGLRQFVACNFLINLRWKGHVGPRGILWELVQQNPIFVVLSVAGIIMAVVTLVRREGRERGEIFPVCVALGGVFGLALIPAVYRQYFLLFLPLLAVFAGVLVARLLERTSPLEGGRAVVVSIALVALSIRPLLLQARSFERGNAGTLEAMRFVLRNTAPDETVLDGFTGLGAFRPHAFYYFFMHGHLRAMWPPDVERDLLNGLRSGTIIPKLIIWDRDVRALSPEIVTFLEHHYAPVEPEPLRARLFDNETGYWTDDGARWLAGGRPGAPHLLVGEGWKRPETANGLAYRSSRGERSWLLVPIRTPQAGVVTVHARLTSPTPDAAIALVINRTAVGQEPLTTGWRDYRFQAPDGVLVSGFNRFMLRYELTTTGVVPAVDVAFIDVRSLARSVE